MTTTGQITFKSYLETAGQIAFETNLGYLSGGGQIATAFLKTLVFDFGGEITYLIHTVYCRFLFEKKSELTIQESFSDID